jgi:sugar phosphate permease
MLRWRIAILISAAIAISYLDRQTLPVAIGEIRKDFPISNQVKAFLDSAFLLTYGLLYVGGGLSSWLLHRGYSVNAARKLALGLSAVVMPCVMLVPHVSVPWVIFLFSVAFCGQQSWSTLVMILPTDLFPKHALGTVAGFVGLGGALGGVVLGQLAGYLLDHGFSYTPVLIVAGSLHIAAFFLILVTVRSMNPLPLNPKYLAAAT